MRRPGLHALNHWHSAGLEGTIKPVETPPARLSPCVARSFSASDVSELTEVAGCLPHGWCLAVESPHGQLALTPVNGYHWAHRGMVFAPDGRAGPANVALRR